ncbi:MAG TPA: acyl carrier protein [Terrimicrobiaceae bacterium]
MQTDSERSLERPTVEAIRDFIVSRLAEEMKVDPAEVDICAEFSSFGLDSIIIFNITGDLAAWLQRDLESTLLWEFPTIESLARFLGADAAPSPEAA